MERSTIAFGTFALAVSLLTGCAAQTTPHEDADNSSDAITASEASKKYGDGTQLVREVPASDPSLGVVTYKAYMVNDTAKNFSGAVLLGEDANGQVKYGLESNLVDGKFTILRYGTDDVEATAPLEGEAAPAASDGGIDADTLARLRVELKAIADSIKPAHAEASEAEVSPQFFGLSEACSDEWVFAGIMMAYSVAQAGLFIAATGGAGAVVVLGLLAEGAVIGGVAGAGISAAWTSAFNLNGCISTSTRGR